MHYHYSITTNSRDELIDFGRNRLGSALRLADRGKPWIISAGSVPEIGGDETNAGKSLVALAIDQSFNPDHYPNGIDIYLRPDRPIDEYTGERKVVFVNFGWGVREDRKGFDRVLADYESCVPDAKVIFISNIERTRRNVEFDYCRLGLASDRLDMRLYFKKISEPFGRKIAITLEDEVLLDHLSPEVCRNKFGGRNVQDAPYGRKGITAIPNGRHPRLAP